MILDVAKRKALTRPLGRVRPAVAKPKIPVSTEGSLVAMPRLDSPFVLHDNLLEDPWHQTIINITRIATPTGVVPGVYLGLTINQYGQVTAANVTGVTIEAPTLTNPVITNPTVNGGTSNSPTIVNANLTGSPIAPTQPIGSNSNVVATTAFVKNQGYLSMISLTGDVSGSSSSGGATNVTVVGLQGHPVSGTVVTGQALVWNGSAWAPGPVGIPEAPMDGQAYARQNGTWVPVIVP